VLSLIVTDVCATGAQPTEPERASKPASASQSGAKVTPSTSTTSRSSRAIDESQYVKASELSVRPSPIGEIRVPSPDKATAKGIVATKVTLFVDEKGTVAKIAFDDPALARPFREAIHGSFEKARFKPGRIGERPVKARMRIEVTFEPRSPDPAPGGSTAMRAAAKK